jgi:SAM-dependent methyltransferase
VKYRCGCENELDAEWGIVRCVAKCQHHRDYLAVEREQGQEYYQRLGTIDSEGKPKVTQHVQEIEAAGIPIPAVNDGVALEIGCGCSPYVGMLRELGYSYTGLDYRPWVAEWMRQTFGVEAVACSFEDFEGGPFDLIFAAHFFEHVPHAPNAMKKAYDMLRAGGTLYLIVPDDQDPTNPDHQTFFTESSLLRLLERLGFRELRSHVARIVDRELFIYASGRK